jgi:hypothetical protein
MDVEGIEFASAGISEVIFRDNVYMRLGLRKEGNLNFLFFDYVARSEGSGAPSEAMGGAKEESQREE